MKQDLQLIWIGDLQIPSSSRSRTAEAIQVPQYHRTLNTGLLDKILIGSAPKAREVNWIIKTAVKDAVISCPHAVIERKSDGSFAITDRSTHGTYVNNVRVLGKVALKENDVVCFGCKYGLQVKAGGSVKPFKWDLKYKVHIVPIEKNEFPLKFSKTPITIMRDRNKSVSLIPPIVNNQGDIEGNKGSSEHATKSRSILRQKKTFKTVAERRAAMNPKRNDSETRKSSSSSVPKRKQSSSIEEPSTTEPVDEIEIECRDSSKRKTSSRSSTASVNEPSTSISVERNNPGLSKSLRRIAPKPTSSSSVNNQSDETPIVAVPLNRHKKSSHNKSNKTSLTSASDPSTSIPGGAVKIKQPGLSINKTLNGNSPTSVKETSASITDRLTEDDDRKPLISTATKSPSSSGVGDLSAHNLLESIKIEDTSHDYDDLPSKKLRSS